jgi:predicted TIM-barrel fold metal-dependent hydrolase
MTTSTLISSDSHLVEPPDLWVSRMPGHLRSVAPRVVPESDCDRWYVGERQSAGSYGVFIHAGCRFGDPADITYFGRFDDVPEAGYEAAAHIADMDKDNIEVSILYPSIGLRLFRIDDDVLLTEICRAYNSWAIELCAKGCGRLKAVAMLNLEQVGTAAADLRDAMAAGFSGVLISVHPGMHEPYGHPRYDPFWEVAEELSAPVSFHVGTNRPMPGSATPDTFASLTAVARVNEDHWVRTTLSSMIFGGVFQRFRGLRVGAVEHELAWAPFFLRQMDFIYRERHQLVQRLPDGQLPSDIFRSNVFMSFQEDVLGIRDREIIGIDGLMWGSDFPHAESTWPRSREILSTVLAGTNESERRKITHDNAVALYGLR